MLLQYGLDLHRADIFDPEVNKACRAITGCIKPTYVEELYLLAGIAPPDIRRDICAIMERTKQMEQVTEVKKGLPDKCETKSLSIQVEASCTTPSIRRRLLNGIPFQRRKVQEIEWQY